MNKFLAPTLLGAALLAAPVAAHEVPECDALDRDSSVNINWNGDLGFDNGDLRFSDGDDVLMTITEDRELFLHGKHIQLDEHGQELVDRYYRVVNRFVLDATDLAGDAAGLGVSAAVEALAMVFTGDDEGMSDFEDRVEERAARIEAQADAMCLGFREIEGIEQEMMEHVPGFRPVAFARRDSI